MAHIILTNFGCFVRDQFKEQQQQQQQQSLEEKEKCAADVYNKKTYKKEKKNRGEKSNYANGEFRPV